MTDALEPAAIIDAAQHAAAAGDYPEAERLLLRAATLQEGRLGPNHPDLAITLNNLALVYERMNKLDEAEHGYRRAHAIAAASLSPGHPFTATSLKNLVDFCAAHKVPIWRPPTVPSDEDALSLEFDTEVQPEPELPSSVPGRTWSFRTPALATLGVVVVLAVVFAVQQQETSDTSTPLPQPLHTSSASAPPATPVTTPAVTPQPEPTVTLERRAETPPAPVETPKPREESITSAAVSVLNAQLCSALERTGSPDWQCVAMDGESQPGTYMFYTRLLTNADTTVEHRWYRGDRVHQVRRLRVAPSSERGFRTFSSTTISPERAGDWKVELRAADGTVLREERFVIR